MMNRSPGALARSITLYPKDWVAIEKFAQENGFSVSLAVRRIIREWLLMKADQCDKDTSA
jgi:hypothetical protein